MLAAVGVMKISKLIGTLHQLHSCLVFWPCDWCVLQCILCVVVLCSLALCYAVMLIVLHVVFAVLVVRYADIIIPWQRGDNFIAIDLITEHIRLKLKQHDLLRIYPNLEVIPSNFQVSVDKLVNLLSVSVNAMRVVLPGRPCNHYNSREVVQRAIHWQRLSWQQHTQNSHFHGPVGSCTHVAGDAVAS